MSGRLTPARALLIGAGALLAASALAAPGFARTTSKTTETLCPPINSRTMVADATAQVFESGPPYNVNTLTEPSPKTIYQGCVFGHRTVSSGLGPLNSYLRPLVIAGDYVAYGNNAASTGDTNVEDVAGVAVWNLLTGQTKTFPGCSRHSGVGQSGPDTVVVKSDGAVAWICESLQTPPTPTYYEVHAIDRNGNRLVAVGTDIDPSSLALAAHNIYWTQNGQAATAPLD